MARKDDTMVMELRLRLDKAEKELSRFVKKAERTTVKLKGIDSKKFTQPLGKITGSVSEFQKSLEASNARVIAFSASAGILMGVTKAFQEMAKATVDVEKSLQDINVIMGATTRNLQKFGAELFQVAKVTGQSFEQVAIAATEFARQGLTMEKTLLRTRDALILTRLSGMGAEQAVNALTAAINSFNKTSINSTEIVNRMANVDAAFAVSTQDLAEAIRRVGASADDVNVTFNEMIAIVTSVQQTTARGGNVIGNSLKTIFTRIQRTEVVNQLKQLGVVVRDTEGRMRPAMQVLTDFAKVYDTLNPKIKSSTAELVGGVYQMNILKAILKDLKSGYSIYSSALDVANNTTNEAIARNAELNKTLHALINETVQNLTAMGAAVGKVTLEPLFRRIMEGFNALNKELTLFGDIGEMFGFDKEDASKFGGDLGGNILKSIGNILSGPGFVALGAIIGKLFLDFTRFLSKAVLDFANLNKDASQQAALQKQIAETLKLNPSLIDAITKKEMTREQVERKILEGLREEIMLREKISQLSAGAGTRAMAQGYGANINKGTGDVAYTYKKPKSHGLIPNFSNMQEFIGALSAGYKPGDIREKFIKGEGAVTYNTAEKVRKFPGMEQEAIMPPQESPAGKTYQGEFENRHGFNPYAHSGFVPNFRTNVIRGGSMRNQTGRAGQGLGRRDRKHLSRINTFEELEEMLGQNMGGNRMGFMSTTRNTAAGRNLASNFSKGTNDSPMRGQGSIDKKDVRGGSGVFGFDIKNVLSKAKLKRFKSKAMIKYGFDDAEAERYVIQKVFKIAGMGQSGAMSKYFGKGQGKAVGFDYSNWYGKNSSVGFTGFGDEERAGEVGVMMLGHEKRSSNALSKRKRWEMFGGFVPSFASMGLPTQKAMAGKGQRGMAIRKSEKKDHQVGLAGAWISAVTRGQDIGRTMGLGRGGTESRATMPQLSESGQKRFEDDLRGRGISITDSVEPVANLRATQKDIYGSNVLKKLRGAFGATRWKKAGPSPMPDWLSNEILVSKDNKILDGHHRWATVYARDAIEDNRLGNLRMKTRRIGLPIQELLSLAESYTGAKQGGGGTGASGGFLPNFSHVPGHKGTTQRLVGGQGRNIIGASVEKNYQQIPLSKSEAGNVGVIVSDRGAVGKSMDVRTKLNLFHGPIAKALGVPKNALKDKAVDFPFDVGGFKDKAFDKGVEEFLDPAIKGLVKSLGLSPAASDVGKKAEGEIKHSKQVLGRLFETAIFTGLGIEDAGKARWDMPDKWKGKTNFQGLEDTEKIDIKYALADSRDNRTAISLLEKTLATVPSAKLKILEGLGLTQQSSLPPKGKKSKAKGFIPNFSPLQDALKTEGMLGGQPALDYHKSVGYYVRDQKTQKNFGDVMRDHPEGIQRAMKNSKAMQESLGYSGFVPNFQEGGTGFDMAIITSGLGMLAFGAKDAADQMGRLKSEGQELTDTLAKIAEEEEALIEKKKKTHGDTKSDIGKQKKTDKEFNTAQNKVATSERKIESQAAKTVKEKAGLKQAPTEGSKGREEYDRAVAEEVKQIKENTKLKRGGAKDLRDAHKKAQERLRAARENKTAMDKQTEKSKQLSRELGASSRATRLNKKAKLKEALAHNKAATTTGQMVKGPGGGMVGGKGVGKGKIGRLATKMSMPMMMMAPMIGGLGRSMAGDNEKAQGAVKGAETLASFTAMGAMAGPKGAAVGAAVGAIVGGAQALNAMNDPMIELTKNSEKATEKLTNFSNASQTYLTALDRFQAGISDENISEDELVKRTGAMEDAFLTLPDDVKNKFKSIGQTTEEIKKTFQDIGKDLAKKARIAKNQESFEKDTDEERGWFVNWTRKVGRGMGMSGVEKADRMFAGRGEEGEKRLERFSGSIMQEVDKEALKGDKGLQNLAALDRVMATMGDTMDPKELNEFTAVMSEFGIPEEYIENIKRVAESSEDGAVASKDLAERLNKAREHLEKLAKAAAHIATLKAIGDRFRTTMADLQKKMELTNVTMKTALKIEKDRIDTISKLKRSQREFFVDFAQNTAKGSAGLAKPFQGKVEAIDTDYNLKAADAVKKNLAATRNAIESGVQKGFSIVASEFDKSNVSLQRSLGTAKDKDDAQRIRQEMAKHQKIQATMAPIIAEHLQRLRDKPETMGNMSGFTQKLEAALKNAGIQNAELVAENLRWQLKDVNAEVVNKLTLIADRAEKQRLILEQSRNLAKRTAQIQESIASFGGPGGYLGGEANWMGLNNSIDKFDKAMYSFRDSVFRDERVGVAPGGGALRGGKQEIDFGRAAFKIADMLTNYANMRKPGGQRMADEIMPFAQAAVKGQRANIIGQLSHMEDMIFGMTNLDPTQGEGKLLAKRFAEMQDPEMAGETAINQIASQLKIENIPKDVAAMRRDISNLNEILRNQGEQMFDNNKMAFFDALQLAGMTEKQIVGGIDASNHDVTLFQVERDHKSRLAQGKGIIGGMGNLSKYQIVATNQAAKSQMDQSKNSRTLAQSLGSDSTEAIYDGTGGINKTNIEGFGLMIGQLRIIKRIQQDANSAELDRSFADEKMQKQAAGTTGRNTWVVPKEGEGAGQIDLAKSRISGVKIEDLFSQRPAGFNIALENMPAGSDPARFQHAINTIPAEKAPLIREQDGIRRKDITQQGSDMLSLMALTRNVYGDREEAFVPVRNIGQDTRSQIKGLQDESAASRWKMWSLSEAAQGRATAGGGGLPPAWDIPVQIDEKLSGAMEALFGNKWKQNYGDTSLTPISTKHGQEFRSTATTDEKGEAGTDSFFNKEGKIQKAMTAAIFEIGNIERKALNEGRSMNAEESARHKSLINAVNTLSGVMETGGRDIRAGTLDLSKVIGMRRIQESINVKTGGFLARGTAYGKKRYSDVTDTGDTRASNAQTKRYWTSQGYQNKTGKGDYESNPADTTRVALNKMYNDFLAKKQAVKEGQSTWTPDNFGPKGGAKSKPKSLKKEDDLTSFKAYLKSTTDLRAAPESGWRTPTKEAREAALLELRNAIKNSKQTAPKAIFQRSGAVDYGSAMRQLSADLKEAQRTRSLSNVVGKRPEGDDLSKKRGGWGNTGGRDTVDYDKYLQNRSLGSLDSDTRQALLQQGVVTPHEKFYGDWNAAFDDSSGLNKEDKETAQEELFKKRLAAQIEGKDIERDAGRAISNLYDANIIRSGLGKDLEFGREGGPLLLDRMRQEGGWEKGLEVGHSGFSGDIYDTKLIRNKEWEKGDPEKDKMITVRGENVDRTKLDQNIKAMDEIIDQSIDDIAQAFNIDDKQATQIQTEAKKFKRLNEYLLHTTKESQKIAEIRKKLTEGLKKETGLDVEDGIIKIAHLRNLNEIQNQNLQKVENEIADFHWLRDKEAMALAKKYDDAKTKRTGIKSTAHQDYLNSLTDDERALRDLEKAKTKGKIKKGDYKPGMSFKDMMNDWKYSQIQMAEDADSAISEIGKSFKSQTVDAFHAGITGAKDFKEAMTEVFDSIADMATKKMLEMAMQQFIFGPVGSFFGSAQGGLVTGKRTRGYSEGGPVVGGSGSRDDVPAMLSKGEYVIKKSSVDKYGLDYLSRLNQPVHAGLGSYIGGLIPSVFKEPGLSMLSPASYMAKRSGAAGVVPKATGMGVGLASPAFAMGTGERTPGGGSNYWKQRGAAGVMGNKIPSHSVGRQAGSGWAGIAATGVSGAESDEFDYGHFMDAQGFALGGMAVNSTDEKANLIAGKKIDRLQKRMTGAFGKRKRPGIRPQGFARGGFANRSGVLGDDPQSGLDSIANSSQRRSGVSAEVNLRNAFIYDSDMPTLGGSYYDMDSRLSRQALTDEDNPRNRIRLEKVQGLYDYYAERQQEMGDWRKAVSKWKKMRKKKMRNLLWTAAGVTVGNWMQTGSAGYGGGPDSAAGKLSNWWSNRGGAGGASAVNLGGGVQYGTDSQGWSQVTGYNSGPAAGSMSSARTRPSMPWNHSKGGLHSRDNVPAMLMGGEYVVNSDTVSKYGVDFFRRLNAGQVKGYAEGGYVDDGSGSTNQSGEGSSSMNNNISITVNIDKGGRVSSDSSGPGGLDAARGGRDLANTIKQQVIQTIIEQQRQGGTLR